MTISLKIATSLGLASVLLMACTSQPNAANANEDAAAEASADAAIRKAADDTVAAAGDAAAPGESK